MDSKPKVSLFVRTDILNIERALTFESNTEYEGKDEVAVWLDRDQAFLTLVSIADLFPEVSVWRGNTRLDFENYSEDEPLKNTGVIIDSTEGEA